MLSTQTRLRLEEIAGKIERGETVTLEESIWAEKWCQSNKSAYEIMRKARRRAINGTPQNNQSLDYLLDRMNLGEPDPQSHKIGPIDPDDLADFFKAPDWTKRD